MGFRESGLSIVLTMVIGMLGGLAMGHLIANHIESNWPQNICIIKGANQ